MGDHSEDDEEQRKIQSNGSFPKPLPPEDPGGKHAKEDEEEE